VLAPKVLPLLSIRSHAGWPGMLSFTHESPVASHSMVVTFILCRVRKATASFALSCVPKPMTLMEAFC
jgi:hypothetical protein